MNLPVKDKTPEWFLCHAIAMELIIEGIPSGVAMQLAMQLVKVVDDSHDDPMIGVERLKASREDTDKWWVEYYPDTDYGKGAAERLESLSRK